MLTASPESCRSGPTAPGPIAALSKVRFDAARLWRLLLQL